MIKIGIIGGSGLENLDIIQDKQKIKVDTPFGRTSDHLTIGKIAGVDVVILNRHGPKHSINPTNVNYRANIWAMKEQGVTHIIAASAVGSLREGYKPGDFVFTDQFIDRTTKRKSTLYEGDVVCHIAAADPFCKQLRKLFADTATKENIQHHEKGTIVVIEGPRFSTRAESILFKSWEADIIGMTTTPECVLAREAGICYAVISMVTDYDCWKEREEVSMNKVMETMSANAQRVTDLIIKLIPLVKEKLTQHKDCECKTAINSALI